MFALQTRVALTTRNVHRTLLVATSPLQVPMKVGVCVILWYYTKYNTKRGAKDG